MKTSELKVGDVITCSDFVYCNGNGAGLLYLDSMVKKCAQGSRGISTSLKYVEQSRERAEFIVVAFLNHSGGMDQGGGYYQGTTEIVAQRLNQDGSYNPDGEKIVFSADAGLSNSTEAVALIRKMKMIFV